MQAAEVVRGPYLQQATPESIIVRWRTDVGTRSQVRYGTDFGDFSGTVSNGTLTTNHVMTITNLLPNTKYFYEVGSASQWFGNSTNIFFVTPPPVGTSQATRIWVIGDSGTADANAAAVRNAYRTVARTRKADLWLMLGDNAYSSGTDPQYQAAVFDMYPDILRNTVLWPTIGNHEATVSPYLSIFTLPQAAEAGGVASGTERYYSFDYGDIHFICLDSWSSDRSSDGEMCNWLRMDLEATTQPWLIAFWHHPPYTKGSHDSDVEVELVAMRRNVLPILESYGVDLVLCGHSHSYERSFLLNGHYGTSSTLSDSMIQNDGDGREDGDGAYRKIPTESEGAVYVVAGSSGQIDGGDLDHAAMFISLNVLGSLVIDVASNRLDVSFLRTNGLTGDYFTLVKEPPPAPPTNAPAAASNLIANAISSSRIDVSWMDNADNEQGFRIERSTNGIDFVEFATASANATNRADTGLSGDTTYHYRVRAYNAFGVSGYSDIAYATTLPLPAGDTTPPAAVTNLFISSMTSNNVTLSWISPGDDANSGTAASYNARYRTTPITEANWASSTAVSGEPIPSTAGTWQSVTIGGLSAGTAYYFALTTSDEANNTSPLSNIATGSLRPPVVSNNIVLIASNSVWKYLDDGSNQGTSWRELAFNDAAWDTGPGKFGYGFSDVTTVVSYGPSSSSKYITTYFRRAFHVSSPSLLTNVLVQLLRDDGAVVYLNGIEVYRSNMPEGAITSSTPAAADVSGSGSFRYYPRTISPLVLHAGTNVIAVELHQASASSSDMAFDLQLTASNPCGSTGGSETPPSLRIARQGTNILLRWPITCSSASYFVEESSSFQGGTDWVQTSETANIVQGWHQLVIVADQSQRLYRLRKP